MLNIASAQDALGDRHGARKTLEGLLAKYPQARRGEQAALTQGAKSKSGRTPFRRPRFCHHALGQARGYECWCLSVDYGQRHGSSWRRRAHRKRWRRGPPGAKLDLAQIGGSALTDNRSPCRLAASARHPVTYVPARNTILLALALGWAEVLGAQHIFVGANAVDYSGYPDCRPEFLAAFQQLANLATKAGVEGRSIEVRGPLVDLPKAAIVKLALNWAWTRR
jgi:queuosine biosynthesis protein QueC